MPNPKKFKVKNLVSKMLGGKVPNSGNSDIPGTTAVGNNSVNFMTPKNPKKVTSKVLKKASKYAGYYKNIKQ